MLIKMIIVIVGSALEYITLKINIPQIEAFYIAFTLVINICIVFLPKNRKENKEKTKRKTIIALSFIIDVVCIMIMAGIASISIDLTKSKIVFIIVNTLYLSLILFGNYSFVTIGKLICKLRITSERSPKANSKIFIMNTIWLIWLEIMMYINQYSKIAYYEIIYSALIMLFVANIVVFIIGKDNRDLIMRILKLNYCDK